MRRDSEAERIRQRIKRMLADVAELHAELPQAEEQDRIRTLADKRALPLLRGSCPEGARLADGEAVLIGSRQLSGIAYGILPKVDDRIQVILTPFGLVGSICIEAKDNAPDADVLLTKLRLCQADEKTLWTTGNYFSDGKATEFLPKQVREWTMRRKRQAEAECPETMPEPACEAVRCEVTARYTGRP